MPTEAILSTARQFLGVDPTVPITLEPIKRGTGDRLERWRKPNIRPKWISPQAYAGMPDSIAVRVVTVTVDPGAGFRTTELQIACTVLDPEKMSASNIGALYQRRWKVELFIDDLKNTLGMAVLTTLSPAMIRREPRAVKRRPKPHQLLNVPRRLMIEISHRSRYKKNTDEITPNNP